MITFAGCALTLRDEEIKETLNDAKAVLRGKTPAEEWEGYEEALDLYGVYLGLEYRFRGHPRKAYDFFNSELTNRRLRRRPMKRRTNLPHWMGADSVHVEHRQALIKRDPDYYIAKFREVRADG
jgi:hypothetical protein